jgi:hypothetical protein
MQYPRASASHGASPSRCRTTAGGCAATSSGTSPTRCGQGFTRRASERNRGGRTDGFTKPNDIDPSANGGRNKRSVWTIATSPYPEAHFATFPPALVEPCILAGTSAKGVCPCCGAPWMRVIGRNQTKDNEVIITAKSSSAVPGLAKPTASS